MKAAIRFINIFANLGNGGAASYHSYLSTIHYPAHFPEKVPEIESLLKQCDEQRWVETLQPSVSSLKSWDVTEERLQVRGVWKKLRMKARSRHEEQPKS